MPLPDWAKVRDALADAIRSALPLQIAQVEPGRISGIGLHIDAYYGSAGLYLLPESAASDLGPDRTANIGDWPISTDWDGTQDHAEAFSEHWSAWEDWLRERCGDHSDNELEAIAPAFLRAACEAMRQVEAEGHLDHFERSPSFRIIILEHDEPDEMAIERYYLFSQAGVIRSFDSKQPGR